MEVLMALMTFVMYPLMLAIPLFTIWLLLRFVQAFERAVLAHEQMAESLRAIARRPPDAVPPADPSRSRPIW